ncbi:MAG: cytochrome C, partial [Polyangiaceae bacterium]
MARNVSLVGSLAAVVVVAACSGSGGTPSRPEPVASTTQPESSGATSPRSRATPVGLAVEVENGVGAPLSVRAGQTFYLNQIDMRVFENTAVDEGVDALQHSGPWASLDWRGLGEVDEAPILLANGDGTFQRRRFYRFARWMDVDSTFTLEQVDAGGHVIAPPVVVSGGREFDPSDRDDYWDRRYRALQWTYDCKTQSDCTGATSFQEEALVELRYAQHPDETFVIQPSTTALRLRWSLAANEPYTIPLTQVASPQYDYGCSIDITPLTAPNHDGTYSPGTDITFQATLRDGSGNRLHPPGSMPSYDDVIFGSDPAGSQYYRAFFDPTMTYYRRKHRERNMMVEFLGPAQDAQAIRHLAPLDEFLTPPDVQNIADQADDGVYAQFKLFPTASDLFGGAFDPAHAAWNNPVSDTWTNHVPSDAVPGTYFVTMKGRRVYLGQDIPFTRTIEVQVGTTRRTQPTLHVGGCNDCHTGQSSLSNILHGNSNLGTCAACHAPLGFEYEGPIYVRLHFIHSRTTRFDGSVEQCSS